MKEPRGLLGQTDLTSSKIHEVVLHTTKPVSTEEDTARLVKASIIHMQSQTLDR